MTPPPPDTLNGSNDAIRCPAYLGSNTARLGYDAHSPWVPGVVVLEGPLRPTPEGPGPDRLWVNADCGLKTRRYSQVLPAFDRMVTAARSLRAEVASGEMSPDAGAVPAKTAGLPGPQPMRSDEFAQWWLASDLGRLWEVATVHGVRPDGSDAVTLRLELPESAHFAAGQY